MKNDSLKIDKTDDTYVNENIKHFHEEDNGGCQELK